MKQKQAIRKKYGHCVDCPPDAPEKPLIGDRCNRHYWIHRDKENKAKIRETRVERAGLCVKQDAENINGVELKVWFEYHMKHCDKCEETGDRINKADSEELFCSQAHIFTKE